MDKNQVKLKIDDLIKRCNILENGDIYTAPDDYYKWVRIKVCAKIAHTNYKLNITLNYLVITIAVVSLMTSMLSLLKSLGNEGITKNEFLVYVFVFLMAVLSIIIIFRCIDAQLVSACLPPTKSPFYRTHYVVL